MRRSTIFRLGPPLLLALAAAACRSHSPPPEATARTDSADTAARAPSRERSYERVFTFTTVGADTAVLVPLFFTARSVPGGVSRRTRGWVGRAGSWEPFVDQTWRTSDEGDARRLVPRRPLRLVVGENDAIESILYDDPPRTLELDLGDELVDWAGTRGGSYRLENATLTLGERRIDGLVLDLARTWTAREAPGGDWALLVSGDSLQMVLQSPQESDPGTPDAWNAFARLDFRQLRWPDVTMRWSESRAYEPARRNVPAAWSFHSDGDRIEGELRAGSAELSAGRGDGPVLPVSAVFSVSGTVKIDGVAYPVRGLVRHRREGAG